MRSILLFAVTLFGVASSNSHHIVHETRPVEPMDWLRTGRLDSNMILPMKFGLVQQNLHKLEEMLMSVSHPDSPTYAQHFTATEVVDTFAPTKETISTVTSWLIDFGFSPDRIRLSGNKGWIHVNASTSEVENLLRTEYHVYAHPSGDTQIGCHNYSLPSHLRQHVDLIKPTVHFKHQPTANAIQRRTGGLGSQWSGPMRSNKSMTMTPFWTTSLANCTNAITPPCLRALYNINYTPLPVDNNTFAIVELTPEAIIFSDLDMFFGNFSPKQVGMRPNVVLVDGAVIQTTNRSRDLNAESSLDLEYAMTLTYPQQVTLMQVGDLVEGGDFDNWLDAVDGSYCTFEGGDDPNQDGIYPDTLPGGFDEPESCGIIKPPNVVSISYGQREAAATLFYAQRQCQEYAKLGMMGTSVLYSSGDLGVAGETFDFTPICLNSAYQEDPSGTNFNPTFPSTCPFVTSVGGTQIKPGSTVYDPEEAWTQTFNQMVGSSSGGFSNIFTLPYFQKDAVQGYSRNFLTPSPFKAGQFNDSGNARAFPDIAANGANYTVAVDGNFFLVSGTSASTPVVASMITLINDARLSVGKKSLGFLNPSIYHHAFAFAFNDITTGSNPGCGTNGFNATRGWDPVTGVGTPNFVKLLALFSASP